MVSQLIVPKLQIWAALLQGSYQPMQLDQRGWYWSQQLQLFLGVQNNQLRFFTPEGQLVPTPIEAAELEQQHHLAAEQRATAAEALLAQYRKRFGELG